MKAKKYYLSNDVYVNRSSIFKTGCSNGLTHDWRMEVCSGISPTRGLVLYISTCGDPQIIEDRGNALAKILDDLGGKDVSIGAPEDISAGAQIVLNAIERVRRNVHEIYHSDLDYYRNLIEPFVTQEILEKV